MVQAARCHYHAAAAAALATFEHLAALLFHPCPCPRAGPSTPNMHEWPAGWCIRTSGAP